MFTRDQAIELLHKNMQNANLRRHCYGVEAVMRALARHFKEDEELWGMVGLLHDADYELTKSDTAKHALTAAGWLKETDADPKVAKAILAHAWKFVQGCPEPVNNLEWSIYTCDELTGLIVAVTLVRPDRKLASVTVESVQKKWGMKAFAAGANREMIALCEEKLGIKLPDFIKIALGAMQSISGNLGL